MRVQTEARRPLTDSKRKTIQKITPYLWFDNQAEEAMNFYVSLFRDSKILSVSRYERDAPGAPGTVLTATFRLAGQEFMTLNGGPYFKFNQAISLFVNCETQEEAEARYRRLAPRLRAGVIRYASWSDGN